jgi:hypothetical protein
MKTPVKPLLVLLCLLMAGCYTLTPLGENVNNSLVNSKDYLKRSFGEPTDIKDSGSYGQIWEYLQDYNVAKPGLEVHVGNKFKDTIAQQTPSVHYLRFWVKDDKVIKWDAKGYDIYKNHTLEIILCTGGVALLVAVIYALGER